MPTRSKTARKFVGRIAPQNLSVRETADFRQQKYESNPLHHFRGAEVQMNRPSSRPNRGLDGGDGLWDRCGQDLTAAVGDEHVILYPDTADVGEQGQTFAVETIACDAGKRLIVENGWRQVDSGLDGDGHSR